MKSSPSRPRKANSLASLPPWLTPTLIPILALGLRLYRLADANLWWDEALAIWAVRKGLAGVTLWTAGDVHPPLYFWSLWGWVQLLGESPFAMRSLSVLFGVLTVASVYALGKLIAGQTLGNLAALLTALSRFHVWWSQEMRMYILAGLLGVLSLLYFLRWLRGERDEPSAGDAALRPKRDLLLYALCAAGSLYTIFLMGALVLVQNLVVLLVLVVPGMGVRRGRVLLRWVLAQLGILAVLALWMALSWGRMPTWSVASPMGPLSLARLYATLLTTGVSVDISRYTWAVVYPLVVCLLGAGCLMAHWRRRRRIAVQTALDALTLFLSCTLTAALVYAATMPRRLFYTPHIEARYFLPFAPAFWLLLAWAVLLIGARWRWIGWGVGVTVVALFALFLPGHYEDRFRRDTLETMTRAIVSQAEPSDGLILDSGSRYPMFLYDYERIAPDAWRPEMHTVSIAEESLTAEQVDADLTAYAVDHERIWLAEVDANLSDAERIVAAWLEGHRQVVLRHHYGPNTLTLYAADGAAPTLANASYTQGLQSQPIADGHLLSLEQPADRVPPEQSIYATLLWDPAPSVPVTLSLVNDRGQVLMSRSGLAAQGVATRQQFDFPVYAATPADGYDLVLSVGGEQIALESLRIAGTESLPEPREQVIPLDYRVDERIQLLGYSLSPGYVPLRPGETLDLYLYWATETKPTRDLTVFCHLLGQAHNPKTQGPVWAGHDSAPADGGYPTSQWLVGDVIVDHHPLIVDPDAPVGTYQMEVGMYTWPDGVRLPITDRSGEPLGDHIILDWTIDVVR